ncbi:sugar transferase [Paenibacillus sp. RS8]|uniref:sugar transferase n=1 Tax=Paenibacillus sp. RS8 TaxID=3242681 RepID=UPI0035C25DD6
MQTEVKSNMNPSFQKAGRNSIYNRYIKRSIDLIFSICALFLLSPVLLLVSILVKNRLGSPVIFKQNRPGRNEKIFTMYKYKTMTNERNEKGELLSDELRLTKFGKFLRSTSLDELPELWNIVRGDMSLVGPRPQLIKDMVFMTQEQRKRHNVLPGLTGLAQINGRNCISWEDKMRLDLQYIDYNTFVGDMKIIFQTIINVFKRDGINTEGMVTAEDLGDYLLRKKKISKDEYYAAIEKANLIKS